MISSKKTIAVLIAVILLLGVGIYFALHHDFSKKEKNAETTDKKANYITAFEKSYDTLDEISLLSEKENFKFVKIDKEKFIANDNQDIILKNSSVKFLYEEICTIMAQKKVEDNVSDLKKYNLENPLLTINAKFNNAEKVFKLGGLTSDGSYFFMIDNTVYLIDSTKADTLMQPFTYYRETNILKVASNSLNEITFFMGNDTISLKKKKDSENWKIESPFVEECEMMSFNENVLSKIGNISVKNFIDDNPKDEKSYGISKNYLYLADSNGDNQKIFIGNKVDGERYVKLENQKCIYSVNEDALTFLDLKALDFTDKFVLLVNIKDISSVEVSDNVQNKKYTLSIDRKNKDEVYKIDGVEVLKEKFTDAYQKIIGIMARDVANEQKSGSPEYSIKYNMNDKTTKLVEFYKYKDRKHLAFLDGKCAYTILSTSLDDMITSIKTAIKK